MNKILLKSNLDLNSDLKISNQSLFLFAWISVIAVPLTLYKQLNLELFLEFLGIGIIITVIPLALLKYSLKFLDLLQYKSNPSQRNILKLSLITLVGCFRGALFFYFVEITELEQPTSLPIRMLLSAITTIFWLTLISIVVEDSRTFRDKYQALLRASIAQIASDKARSRDFEIPEDLKPELLEIQVLLDRTFSDAGRLNLDQNALLFAAREVRNTINENIRPLSHKLWKSDSKGSLKIRLTSIVWTSIKKLSVPPLACAIFIGLALFPILTADYGLMRSLYGTVITITVIVFFYQIYKMHLIKYFDQRIILNIFALLFPGTLISASLYVSNKFLFSDNTGLFTFIYSPYCFFIALLFSSLNLARSDRNRLLELLQRSLISVSRDKYVEDEVVANHLASFLHNSLQSELVALSYQIEDSVKNPSPEKSILIEEKVRDRANRLLSQDFRNFIEDPLDRLERVQSAWKGIATINLDLPQALLRENGRNFLVVQILEEAISNSVRHSKSTEISVFASDLQENGIELKIISNGSFHEPSSVGLGTEWLDRYASGRWSRTVTETGSILSILL